MSQHIFMDQQGHRWMVGWDNPCQGFFALRENPEPKPESCGHCPIPQPGRDCDQCPLDAHEDFDILVGYAKGVPLEELDIAVQEHGLLLNPQQLDLLTEDRKREERPLSPLQQQVHAIFADLLKE